jgi:hypothetical protein
MCHQPALAVEDRPLAGQQAISVAVYCGVGYVGDYGLKAFR